GEDVPLHFSRFQPHYLMRNIPATSYQTLQQSYKIAKDAGLQYVYIGNIYGTEEANTYCPNCQKLLIGRTGYKVIQNKIESNRCPYCQKTIAGIWGNSV
ncbi:MAG: hypothetical protein PHQ54_02700, partial [Candidatus Omnitrophica bacterium]|nr:hypothetical protein [Candidatus Omnitrophota bacterium]